MTGQLKLFETIELENGLTLRLYNSSRIIAEKLWYVSLTGEVEIPVTESAFELSAREALDMEAVKAALGDRVVFQKKMERNYIAEDKKDSTLLVIREYFMDSIVTYLSRGDFPARYILKCYKDFLRKGKLEAQRVGFSGE